MIVIFRRVEISFLQRAC